MSILSPDSHAAGTPAHVYNARGMQGDLMALVAWAPGGSHIRSTLKASFPCSSMAPFPPPAPNRIPTRADVPEESLWSGAPPSAASTFVPVGLSGASSTSYSEVTSLGALPTNGDSLRDISDIIAPLTIGGHEQSVQSGANARLGDESITDKVDAGSTCTGDSDNEPQHQDCDLSLDSVTAGCPHAEAALRDPDTAQEIRQELIRRKGGGGKGGGGGSSGGSKKSPPKAPSSTPDNKGTGPDGSVPVGTSGADGTETENSSEPYDSSSHDEDDEDHNRKYIIGGAVGGVVGVILIGGIWWYIRKNRQKKLKQRSNNSDPAAEAAAHGGLLLCIACC
jgi:hypothetical protein